MIKNIEESRFFIKGELESGLFGGNMRVLIKKDVDMDFAQKCAEAFENMDGALIDKLCGFSIGYSDNFAEYNDDEPIRYKSPRDVLNYIRPSALNIQKREGDDTPGFSVEFECRWEEENGMEWVVRGNEILYVGPFINIGPKKEREFYLSSIPNFAFGSGYDM